MSCSNDAFDADMNTDGNKPESVVNLTGNRNGVLATAVASFTVGILWLWSLVTGPVSIPQIHQHHPRQQANCACIIIMRISCVVTCRLFRATPGYQSCLVLQLSWAMSIRVLLSGWPVCQPTVHILTAFCPWHHSKSFCVALCCLLVQKSLPVDKFASGVLDKNPLHVQMELQRARRAAVLHSFWPLSNLCFLPGSGMVFCCTSVSPARQIIHPCFIALLALQTT